MDDNPYRSPNTSGSRAENSERPIQFWIALLVAPNVVTSVMFVAGIIDYFPWMLVFIISVSIAAQWVSAWRRR